MALVTGASSGIGAATARALAAEGATVALAARRRHRLEAIADEVRERGGAVQVIEADVSRGREAESAVHLVVEEQGRLDVLVNNAGVMLLGPVRNAQVEDWEQMIQVNLLGVMYCARAALPHLLEAAATHPRGCADLVNVSSVAGRQVRLGSGGYSATKHAVGAFSESLRQEVTGRHVRVGLIEPGAVATELVSHNRPEVRELLEARLSSLERLTAEDVAEAIMFTVTRPRHVAVNEIMVRPTGQEH